VQTPSAVAEWLKQRPAQQAFAALPITTGIVASLAVALVLSVRHERSQDLTNGTVACAGVAVGLALVLAATLGRRHLRLPAPAWSWALALHLGVLCGVIPIYLLVTPAPAERLTGWIFPVLNKRWLIACYNLAIVTVLVFPLAIERWRAKPGAAGEPAPALRSRRHGWGAPWMWAGVGQAVMVGLGWYLAGPPWHLERYRSGIDWHEQMRLGGLQAIAKGYPPFIGPAAFPHGPGTQLIVYTVMKATRHFDLVGFRTGWATLNLLAFLVMASAAYWFTSLGRAFLVVLLAVVFSPFIFFTTQPDGTLVGFYGWANALRYIAPLVVVPALARLAPDESRRVSVVVVGALWGVGAWLAQENLTTTAVAAGLLLVLCCLTTTVSVDRALRVTGYLIVGFVSAVAPILGYYAWRGVAGEFVHNYFFVARAVMDGWSNTWWSPQDTSPIRMAYYWTLPFLLVLGVAALWRPSPLRSVTPLGRQRALFVAFVCVQLACFQSALLRSDSSHVLNTLIALPFIIVLGSLDVARWLGETRGARVAVRAAFLATVLVVYPAFRSQLPFTWTGLLSRPAAKFTVHRGQEPPDPYEGRSAYQRVPRLLHDEPELGNTAPVSMRTFLDFATDVKDIVGSRKTYVRDLGRLYFADGLLYFLANLTPAPALPDRDTMTLNDEVRRAVADRIRMHPREFECFIASSLDGPEAEAFLDTHPDAQRLERRLGMATLYILLSPRRPDA